MERQIISRSPAFAPQRPTWLEAGIVISGMGMTCALTYEIVRRISVLRPLFGLKVSAFEPTAPAQPSVQPAQ